MVAITPVESTVVIIGGTRYPAEQVISWQISWGRDHLLSKPRNRSATVELIAQLPSAAAEMTAATIMIKRADKIEFIGAVDKITMREIDTLKWRVKLECIEIIQHLIYNKALDQDIRVDNTISSAAGALNSYWSRRAPIFEQFYKGLTGVSFPRFPGFTYHLNNSGWSIVTAATHVTMNLQSLIEMVTAPSPGMYSNFSPDYRGWSPTLFSTKGLGTPPKLTRLESSVVPGSNTIELDYTTGYKVLGIKTGGTFGERRFATIDSTLDYRILPYKNDDIPPFVTSALKDWARRLAAYRGSHLTALPTVGSPFTFDRYSNDNNSIQTITEFGKIFFAQKTAPRKIIIKDKYFKGDEEHADRALFDTWESHHFIEIVGDQVAGQLDAAPHYRIIGGTLKCTADGLTHEATIVWVPELTNLTSNVGTYSQAPLAYERDTTSYRYAGWKT